MLFYPHDLHETYFEIAFDVVFNSTSIRKIENFLSDFDIIKTEVKLTNSESTTLLRFNCLLQRKIWAQAYLLMPIVAFYVALLFVPFIKLKEEEWLSMRLTIIVAIITFASLNLWSLYYSIQHVSSGSSILEFDLYLLLVLCTFTLMYSVVDRCIPKKPVLKKTRALLYSPFLVFPFFYWVYYCLVDPALLSSKCPQIGKIMLLFPVATVIVALPILLIFFGLPEESKIHPPPNFACYE